MIARDIAFDGDRDGNLLPVLKRDGLERPQDSVLVDSLDRFLHTSYSVGHCFGDVLEE
jgi:hypothetical protein